ncbi:hemocyanin 1 [Biomphalaria glabrata]|nr:hemocyanin 1 [Biomphalaria glabrata]
MKVVCPSLGPVLFERNVNAYHLTGHSENDNLCHYTGVEPKTPTYSYPQYDERLVCPPNRFIEPRKLPGELQRFNNAFERRRRTSLVFLASSGNTFHALIALGKKKQLYKLVIAYGTKIFGCQPYLPPAYRPVFPVPPAEYWTHVDMCNPWSFFDRSACCDKPRPYNWVNDSCPTQYCRPGGKATPPYVIPYPNMGLYFPPCQAFRVKC